MGLLPTGGDERRCHPERSEGSAVPVRNELMQILRSTQNDRLSGESNFPSLDKEGPGAADFVNKSKQPLAMSGRS